MSNRHAYINFTSKPYIDTFGFPCQKLFWNLPNKYDDRTIIRNNMVNRNITSSVPPNGMNNIPMNVYY